MIAKSAKKVSKVKSNRQRAAKDRAKAFKITIFGGGTSGWLTAAYMSKNLDFPNEITLIESKKVGPIGVGEGTQPATARFLYDAGLNPKDWMRPSSATFKYGVLLDGWNKKPYFVDNDFVSNTVMAPDFYTHDYFGHKPADEFRDWLPSYRLSMANKSPKLAGYDHVVSQDKFKEFGAVHFSAQEICGVIHNLIKNRIRYFDTKIVEVKKNAKGIMGLIDEEGRVHSADLFIDCSGFEARLISKSLNVPFMDVSSILPCDRAVAMPTQYQNPKTQCHPYTRSTTMKAGWRWTIPIFNRIGNGYVYSSKFLSEQEAETELRAAIGEKKATALHLKMRCGAHEKVAVKNVVAVGLAGGFVEPLEATGITFTTMIVENLVSLLNGAGGKWMPDRQRILNKLANNMFLETTAFVWAHYFFSSRNDTPFWKAIRKQRLEAAPDYVREIVGLFYPKLHRDFFVSDRTSSFHTGHWFSMIQANGAFNPKDFRPLKKDEKKYAEYFTQLKSAEVDAAIATFPNHFEFLKGWYAEK